MTKKYTIKDIDFPLNHLDGDILTQEFTKDELEEIKDFYFKLSKLGETKQLTFLLTNMLRCDKIYL